MVGQEAYTVPARRQHPRAAVSLLQIVCAWCQQHIVWHRVQSPISFQISYSICAYCYADVSRGLAPRTAGAASPGLRAL
jgi:hypothetical protein